MSRRVKKAKISARAVGILRAMEYSNIECEFEKQNIRETDSKCHVVENRSFSTRRTGSDTDTRLWRETQET
eukprot:357431-Pyramimonas_sp.AAC.1